MQSKKALAGMAVLILLVTGGIVLGIARQPSGSSTAAYDQNFGLGQAYGPASSSPADLNALGGTSTLGSVASTTVSSTATMVASSVAQVAAGQAAVYGGNNGGTTVITPNQPSASGAQLSASSSQISGSGDIEFFTNVTLQAVAASTAFTKATAIAYSVGGYVSDSTETNSSALVVMRVPAASDQTALGDVEALGTLVALSSSSNDVTVEYSDLNATLSSLQAEQASLLTILQQSTNINSTLEVESRIQGVVQQINSVESQILETKTLVTYATISVTIEQKAPMLPLTIKVTATPKSGTSPLSVTFNALVKGGEQPYIVNYNFGDGTSYEGQSLIHNFNQSGNYNVTVTATDADANVTSAWVLVRVSPPAAISGLAGFTSFVGGLFLHVVEGIVEVAVVAVPIAGTTFLVVYPLRRRLEHERDADPQRPVGEA